MNVQLPATPADTGRVRRSLVERISTAAADALKPAPAQIENGDEQAYADKSGTYTKCIRQSGIGVVDPVAFASFRQALDSGDPADFQAILQGGPRTQNDPQGGLAYSLEGLDNAQFTAPPAPGVATDWYATELIELYWGSLLRDVAFSDYATHPRAIAAAAELTTLPEYRGPRHDGVVTPNLLFRGALPGETEGPYLSQFLLQNTALGALPITQRYDVFAPGTDFMLDDASFQAVQNGAVPPANPIVGTAFLHNGRGLAAYTHVDVLYQAYFTAYLVLSGLGAPANPGSPYAGSTTQNGFVTFGGPDVSAALAAVADIALKVVWYQKWFVHLRHRPESGGALVNLVKTGRGGSVMAQPTALVLNSAALEQAHVANHSWYLSQAFPEGSPAHPAYPTGHGTVAGACITMLKFFFDGNWRLPSTQHASADGSTLQTDAAAAGTLSVNGELHKLAHNVSLGHGVHAGIHWRSDTDASIALGEEIALSVLRDRAKTYNTPFSVTLTRIDGSPVTISKS